MNARSSLSVVAVWVALVGGSLAWNWHQVDKAIDELARVEARSSFEKDLVYRRWVSIQGGVYVPPTDHTPPNPYLERLPERDVTTTDGRKLTLVNPAYMTRQVHEIGNHQYGTRGHITSLNPLRPGNAADTWETRALKAFEAGAREASGMELIDGQPFLRLMRPLVTEGPCLKCHADQGYKVGDIRGGISVSVPFKPYLEIAAGQHSRLVAGHGIIGALGLAGLGFALRHLRKSEEKLKRAASVFSHASEGIMITAPDATIIDVNDAFERITGYSRDEVIGHNPRLLASGRHDKGFYRAMWSALKGKGLWVGEVWNRRRNGEVYAEMLNISSLRDAHGDIRQYVALFSDISLQKRHETELERVAHYDALTALPNRVLLADRLGQAMAQAPRRGLRLAVAYIDLDGFKEVNDAYGHEIGDRLLAALAGRMRLALREGDTIARMGGDEFVAVLIDLADAGACVPLLERLLACAAEPVVIGEATCRISASVGVTFYPQASEIGAEQLLRQADQAMYQAKVAGKNRYHFFDGGMLRS